MLKYDNSYIDTMIVYTCLIKTVINSKFNTTISDMAFIPAGPDYVLLRSNNLLLQQNRGTQILTHSVL